MKFSMFAGALLIAAGLSGAARAEDLVARGKYLADIMDCTGCHTNGALAGQPDMNQYLAGSDIGFMVPGVGFFYPSNLTPDDETGLGRWSEAEIIRAVREGVRPDGRELFPIMPWKSYASLNDADATALAAYLKSMTPVSHKAPGPFGADEKPRFPYLAPVMPE